MGLMSSGRRTNGESALPPGPSWRSVIEVVSRVRPEGWLVEPLPSGVWLRDPRVPILPIVKVPISAPETERPCVVLQGSQASEPDAERALGAVLAALRVAGVASVRLVASRVPAEVAQRLAERADLELIAADGAVRVEPAGLVVRAPADDPLTMARWRAYRPASPPTALGPVHPAPTWERAVEFVAAEGFGLVHRVAAGLIVAPGGLFDPALLRVAAELPVQADMPAIVASSDDGNGDVIQSVDELLAALPEDLDAVRLYLDRAALGGPASIAGMLARRHHLDIVAPHASLDWREAPSNKVGGDRWLRVTPDDPFPAAAGRRARRSAEAAPAESWPRTGRAARSLGPEESTRSDEYLGSDEFMGSQESMGFDESTVSEERLLDESAGSADAGQPDGAHAPYESPADSADESFADWYTAPAPPPDLEPVAPGASRDRGAADRPPLEDDASLAESPVGQEQDRPPEVELAISVETVERRGPICRVSRDHRSTDVERRILRERLGSRFDLHLVVVNRLVANSPALRAGTAARPAAAIIADLVAVRAYLGGDLPELDDPDEPSNGGGRDALVACVVSGLRHLPTHRGMAFRTLAGTSASQWRVGQRIMEDWFTVAVLDGARLARPGVGGCRVAIWSETARRFASLFNDVGDAVFAAGTSFTVLEVDEGGGGRPGWLYLREEPADVDGAAGQAGQLSEVQLRTLTRLRAVVGQLPPTQETDAVPGVGGSTGSDPGRREAREVGPASPTASGTGQPGVARGPGVDGWTATTGGSG